MCSMSSSTSKLRGFSKTHPPTATAMGSHMHIHTCPAHEHTLYQAEYTHFLYAPTSTLYTCAHSCPLVPAHSLT